FNPASCADTSTLTCLSGSEEEPVDYNSNGSYDGANGIYNGLLCPEGAPADVCTKELVHVRANRTIIFSSGIQEQVLTRDGAIYVADNPALGLNAETEGGSFTVYIADRFNNPPATDSVISFESGCKLAGNDSVIVPLSIVPGALGVSFTLVPNFDNEEAISDAITITVDTPNVAPSSVSFSCFDPANVPAP
ncbi:MAG: hypothetical protein ACI9GW_000358, partial [Halieaceae bacterium]